MPEPGAKKWGSELAKALGFSLFALLAGRVFLFDIVTVDGRSMLPSMQPGDIVFVWKAAYGITNPFGGYLAVWARPKNRDVVAAITPDTKALVVKRVKTENPGFLQPGFYYLLGDNFYESADSREFGPVPMRNILGKVYRLPRL
jgi:signal peptidase I